MGLTRERWRCAGCWLSKLDMNTCQTSIKTDILFNYTSVLILGIKYMRHHNGLPTVLTKRGKVKRINTGLPNTYRRSKLLKLPQHPIGQNSLLIYPHFCIDFVHKAAAAVTHVQSQSQKIGSGDEGLGLFGLICHQQKRTFGGWRTSSRGFASHFLVSYDVLHSS